MIKNLKITLFFLVIINISCEDAFCQTSNPSDYSTKALDYKNSGPPNIKEVLRNSKPRTKSIPEINSLKSLINNIKNDNVIYEVSTCKMENNNEAIMIIEQKQDLAKLIEVDDYNQIVSSNDILVFEGGFYLKSGNKKVFIDESKNRKLIKTFLYRNFFMQTYYDLESLLEIKNLIPCNEEN